MAGASRLRHGVQVFRRGPAHRLRRDRLHLDGRQRRIRARRRHWRDDLEVRGQPGRQDHDGVLRLDQPRRRDR